MSFFKKLKTDIEGEESPKTIKTAKKKPVKEDKEEKEIIPIKEDTETKKKDAPKPKKKAQDWLQSEGQLAVDVYETDSDFYVRAPIAGVEPEEIDVSVENGMLIIRGERKYTEEAKEKNYFYKECYWGSFSRQILLPEDADADKVKASLKKGILTVKIPKASRLKKRKISVLTE